MGRLSLKLLGGFQSRLGDGPALILPTKKVQGLLAYLSLPPGHAHPRDKLATLLWGGMRDEQARNSLRQALFALRKALAATEPPALRPDRDLVALDPGALDVDVVEFERQVATGTSDALERAAALYDGDLLEGLVLDEPPFEEWLRAERERLRELALEAVAQLLVLQRRAGEAEGAVKTALRLLALDPLQEAVHRTLMRLYAQLGRRGAALRQYQACVGVLQRELSVEPEAETKELYRELLRQRSGRPLPELASAARQAPFPAHVRAQASGMETPLVGREPEVFRLRELLDGARAGRGAAVVLRGEAGIGKTRLVSELHAIVEAVGGVLLLGRAYESEQILPFGPWVGALRSPAMTRESHVVDKLSPRSKAELARLVPELVPGAAPSAGAGDHVQLFESLAELVWQLALHRPVMFALEDLHWADEMSLRLLGFLARRLGDWPAIIVATTREEELADAPMLSRLIEDLAREGHLVALRVGPLSHPDTVALVRSVARAGSDESTLTRLADHAWRASEGNPFVAVEMVRAHAERARLGDADAFGLPHRVRELISRRLERLSEHARTLVAVGAVIGREFDFALLQRAAHLGEVEAAAAVEELVRRRVLQGVGERFDFIHDRIREVAYGGVLGPTRRLLHRHIAEAIEALYADRLGDHVLALGLHYREAEVWVKAVAYLRQAGVRAGLRGAYRDAASCFEQALEAFGRLPAGKATVEEHVDLRFELRTALWPLAEFERNLVNLRAAEALAQQLEDRSRFGWVSAYTCVQLWFIGRTMDALASGETAVAVASSVGAPRLRAMACFYLGLACLSLGDYARSETVLRETLLTLERDLIGEDVRGPGIMAVSSRAWLIPGLAERGCFDEAIAQGREGIRMAEAADHPYSLVSIYWGLAYVLAVKGELAEAIVLLERSLALAQRWEIGVWTPVVTVFLGHAYAQSARVREGIAVLEDGRALYESSGQGSFRPLVSGFLGEAYARAGRAQEALSDAERALMLARDRRERGHEAYALRLLGEFALDDRRRELDRAEGHHVEALALARQLGMRPLQARCHLGLGRVHRLTGRPERARAELSAARDLFESMRMTHWLTEAEAELATV